MSVAIRAAAERLRRLPLPEDDPYLSCNADAMWRDRELLSNAYLDEHPADDGELVTLEWLKSLGWLPDQTGWPAICLPETPEWGISWRGHGIWLTPISVPLCRAPMRGDIRRLCKAMGVELRESPEQDG